MTTQCSSSTGVQLDAGMAGWIRKTAIANYWRVATYMDVDDLIQDGYRWYCECLFRYPHVTNRAHFMSLLKTCFNNHLNDLSNKRSQLREDTFTSLSRDDQDEAWWADKLGCESEIAPVYCLVKEAPPEIAAAVKLLLSDEGRAKLRSAFKRNGRQRETTNEWICRLVGLDPTTINLRSMLEQYLRPA